MDRIEICKKLESTTQKIALFSNDKLLGTGTGVVIRNDGIILTANHVISAFDKVNNPKIIVIGKDDKNKALYHEYIPVLRNVSFDTNMPEFITSLEIDLAILKPKNKINVGNNFIPLCDNITPVGTDVLMAGFPDEIKPPLDVTSKFNFNNPEMKENEVAIKEKLSLFMSLMMVKSGMVGAAHKIILNANFNSKNINVEGVSYWIDNASTYGASGGALVNSSGELVGILCEKAMTKFLPNVKIPSGSTLALSHKLITWGMYLCD